MANFAIFVLGTSLWAYWAYRPEFNIAFQYLKTKFRVRKLKYIRKDVV